MTKYVVGLYFKTTRTGDKVALINKLRPAWQAGKVNGIGGKVEAEENHRAAMQREFFEETGVNVFAERWRLFLLLRHSGNSVRFYVTWQEEGDEELVSMTDESVQWYNVGTIPHLPEQFIMHNLRWIIPLALDKDNLHGIVFDTSKPWEKTI